MSMLPTSHGRHRQTGQHVDLDAAPQQGLSRRDLMKIGSLAAVGVAAGFGPGLLGGSSASAATAKFPGHKPGKIYLGVSVDGPLSTTLSRTGPVGLQRTYYKWGDATRETNNIKADHAAGRMPWISFKPPFTTAGGWAAVASGRYDADIRARARRYAGYGKPVIVTFNHEPHNDRTGTPADWARAWVRIHDVMKNETSLKNVISVPIIGDWVFNPVNKKDDPKDYLTQAVLSRMHFLGVDLYQNQSGDDYSVRLGRTLSWLNSQGHSDKMVGVGETGATDDYRSPTGAQWWQRSWSWAVSNVNRVAAISYFNSQHNNNSGNTWLLWESASKLTAFKSSLSSSTFTKL